MAEAQSKPSPDGAAIDQQSGAARAGVEAAPGGAEAAPAGKGEVGPPSGEPGAEPGASGRGRRRRRRGRAGGLAVQGEEERQVMEERRDGARPQDSTDQDREGTTVAAAAESAEAGERGAREERRGRRGRGRRERGHQRGERPERTERSESADGEEAAGGGVAAEALPEIRIADLHHMSVKQLIELAKSEGVQDTGGLNKSDLINKILRERVRKRGSLYGEGVLEVLPDGFGFLRSAEYSYLASPNDIYVSPSPDPALRPAHRRHRRGPDPPARRTRSATSRCSRSRRINGEDPERPATGCSSTT
ncbi:MAG: hypothetical protein KatS3mg102_0621 [Planctomycetota bacterium]|nr:MAG: hypothetical protein KatS3mg102_0621 [Planctomycetota bacterium]